MPGDGPPRKRVGQRGHGWNLEVVRTKDRPEWRNMIHVADLNIVGTRL